MIDAPAPDDGVENPGRKVPHQKNESGRKPHRRQDHLEGLQATSGVGLLPVPEDEEEQLMDESRSCPSRIYLKGRLPQEPRRSTRGTRRGSFACFCVVLISWLRAPRGVRAEPAPGVLRSRELLRGDEHFRVR